MSTYERLRTESAREMGPGPRRTVHRGRLPALPPRARPYAYSEHKTRVEAVKKAATLATSIRGALVYAGYRTPQTLTNTIAAIGSLASLRLSISS